MPSAEQFKASVCGRSLVGNEGSNPARGMHICLSLVIVVCCQVCASG